MQTMDLFEGKQLSDSTPIKAHVLDKAEIDNDSTKLTQSEPLSSEDLLKISTCVQSPAIKLPKWGFAQSKRIADANNKVPKSLQEISIPKVKTSNTAALPQIIKKNGTTDTAESNSKFNDEKSQKVLSENHNNTEKEISSDIFTSRYALYIQNLEKSAKDKKANEEIRIKQKEKELSKIRENMGLNKVQSKLVSLKKPDSQIFDIRPQMPESEAVATRKNNQENLFREDAQTAKPEVRKTTKIICDVGNPNENIIMITRNTLKSSTIAIDRLNRHLRKSIPDDEQLRAETAEKETYNSSENNIQFESNKKQKAELKTDGGEEAAKVEEEKGKKAKGRRKGRSKASLSRRRTALVAKKNKPKPKVFIVLDGYWDIKKALLDRGWVENTDKDSKNFDFKWTTNACDVWDGYLDDNQLANHYPGNEAIVTKIGLSRSLKLLTVSDHRSFYPRCFDLNSTNDVKAFIRDFIVSKAESVLKMYLNLEGKVNKKQQKRITVSLRICKRYLQKIDEINEFQVLQQEWNVISPEDRPKSNKKSKGEKSTKPAENPGEVRKDEEKKDASKDEKDKSEKPAEEVIVVNEKLLKDVKSTLEYVKSISPQFDLNAENNIWIVKPARLSRGRGIDCCKNLNEILAHTKKGGDWVVQKYIENPLIIHKRKFDIRQWVLVTDWSPLTVWFYEECYLRFGALEFDPKKLDNRFIHLTNNSVTKYCKVSAEEEIEGNMWTCQEFEEHLKTISPSKTNLFAEKIKPSMRQIVNWSLQSAQRYVERRKNCFELVGYDFMVDENYNVWLIEINCSPAMDYSTEVTKRLVKMVLEDTIKVVIDADMGKDKQTNTGLFTCIYRNKSLI